MPSNATFTRVRRPKEIRASREDALWQAVSEIGFRNLAGKAMSAEIERMQSEVHKASSEFQTSLGEARGEIGGVSTKVAYLETTLAKKEEELRNLTKEVEKSIPMIAERIARELVSAIPAPTEVHHHPVIERTEVVNPIHTEKTIERIVEHKRTHEARSLVFHYDRDRIIGAKGQDETYTVKYNQFGVPSEIRIEPNKEERT